MWKWKIEPGEGLRYCVRNGTQFRLMPKQTPATGFYIDWLADGGQWKVASAGATLDEAERNADDWLRMTRNER